MRPIRPTWRLLQFARKLTLRFLFGPTVANGLMNFAHLQKQMSTIERVLQESFNDPWVGWLYANRDERMDPSVTWLFDSSRAEFHLDRYRFAASYAVGQRVVDVACGVGYGAEILATSGQASSVIGVDIDNKAIEYARDRHSSDLIDYVVASADSTGLIEACAGLVVSFETIEHVPDDSAFLEEVVRILKPGGVFVCSTPNNWPLEIAKHHVRSYDRKTFLKVLGHRFADIQLYNQNSGTDSPYNHGQAAGVVETTSINAGSAECFIAVCRKTR